ncbi:hypothetical protein CRENBAI_021659 [Crenichthys baileyi]|uniref:VPS37 C-terminal domain-containing protein n=1 Tax=Crenichthys baileyi TaxID=28760 RepID=A0AAV9RI61_9TELE
MHVKASRGLYHLHFLLGERSQLSQSERREEGAQARRNTTRFKMSSFATKFSGYTMTQLNEFLEDDEKLSGTVQEMDEMQEVQQNKEKTLANNRTLAEQNLTLQPQLEHKKEQLTKSYICLQESFESYQLRKSRLDHKSGTTSLDTLLALLQAGGPK